MTKGRSIAIVSNDKEVTDLVEHCVAYELVGIFDKNPDVDTGGVPVLGPDDQWHTILESYPGLRIALAVDSPALKRKLLLHYGVAALETVVSPHAYVAGSAHLESGCIVQHGVKVLPGARLGLACKLNINATVHHDSSVGDCCTLAPGCQLLGNVVVEDEVFVGAGAILSPRVRIGAGSVIGAGAVVIDDVPCKSTVAGVPARPLNKSTSRS